MITTGIKDAKNNLSRYLSRVKSGEEVVITERGKPIARIIKENGEGKSLRAALAPLLNRGIVSLPDRRLKKKNLKTIRGAGKLVSEMVIEDRR